MNPACRQKLFLDARGRRSKGRGTLSATATSMGLGRVDKSEGYRGRLKHPAAQRILVGEESACMDILAAFLVLGAERVRLKAHQQILGGHTTNSRFDFFIVKPVAETFGGRVAGDICRCQPRRGFFLVRHRPFGRSFGKSGGAGVWSKSI